MLLRLTCMVPLSLVQLIGTLGKLISPSSKNIDSLISNCMNRWQCINIYNIESFQCYFIADVPIRFFLNCHHAVLLVTCTVCSGVTIHVGDSMSDEI